MYEREEVFVCERRSLRVWDRRGLRVMCACVRRRVCV